MDPHQQHQRKREKLTELQRGGEGKEDNKQNQENHDPSILNQPRSPPSSSSSPSHEFSFTISLHPSTTTPLDRRRTPPAIAIDLSPADDIFFHGHLLPLHLLSHPSISPRTSTTSVDNLGLPMKDIIFDHHKPNGSKISTTTGTNRGSASPTTITKGRTKAKSFSFFRLSKWRKPFEMGERDEEKKRAVRFDVGRIFRKYARVVRPLLFFRGEKEKREFRRQPHSFSGNLNTKWKDWGGGRRRGGQFSAPASIRTSPTNSGLLVATATISSSNDSTMEELQGAIQAAIAHCKNSINAVNEDKCKC